MHCQCYGNEWYFFHTIWVILAVFDKWVIYLWLWDPTVSSHNKLGQIKKNAFICRASFYAKMQKIIDILIKETGPFTLQWTHLCVLKSGKVNSAGIWNLKGQHGLLRRGVGRMILMVSLAFFVEINGNYWGKSPNCVSIVLGFRQCLGEWLHKNFSEFQMYNWDALWGEYP